MLISPAPAILNPFLSVSIVPFEANPLASLSNKIISADEPFNLTNFVHTSG
jgi:hypothetical protein